MLSALVDQPTEAANIEACQNLKDENQCKRYNNCYESRKKTYERAMKEATERENSLKAKHKTWAIMACMAKRVRDPRLTTSAAENCLEDYKKKPFNVKYPPFPEQQECAAPEKKP